MKAMRFQSLFRFGMSFALAGSVVSGCGDGTASKPAIVGGQAVKGGELASRSTVALAMKADTSFEGKAFCTGTLVNGGGGPKDYWIVTAAHCVYDIVNPPPPQPVTFVKSEWNPAAWKILEKDPSCKDKIREAANPPKLKAIYVAFGGTVQKSGQNPGYDPVGTPLTLNEKVTYIPVPVSKQNIIVHSSYNPNIFASPEETKRNIDLALIRITSPEKVPAYARVAALPTSAILQKAKSAGLWLIAAGYGSAGSIMRAWEQAQNCEHILTLGVEWKHKGAGVLRWRNVSYKSEYGARMVASAGGCKGDSGGPLYYEEGGKLTLIGALSAEHMGSATIPATEGKGYADMTFCRESNEYANVLRDEAWIKRNLKLQ